MRFILIVALSFLTLISSLLGQSAIYSGEAIHHPIIAENGMVASQHYLATEVGLEILKDGGNAVDAAVAVGFALAVVLPRAGNIGGGGFMLVYDQKQKDTKAYNYREMAPASASRDMFLDENGKVDKMMVGFSHQAAGVPGTVSGLVKVLETHGTMSLKKVLAPAIKLAEDGFPISYDLANLLILYEDRLRRSPATAKIFYPAPGRYYKGGDILKQKDLAWSLKQISKHGSEAFYKGKIAERIVADQEKNGGIISMKDMANYHTEVMEPVTGEYRGYKVASMPPPSSGGVHIIQMLNVLEQFPLGYLGHNSAETIHLITEVMKRAYADRSEHLGDPNFHDVPTEWLTSKEYAQDIAADINRWTATPSSEIKAGTPTDLESDQTTQFTVADKWGNLVTNTYTLNYSFGSGIIAEGTGIMLNNEMDDFSAKPGVPNVYGLIGGEANAVQPGKRPLSSMTPTLVFHPDGSPYFATGSPGGSRIITTVLQVIMNIIDHQLNAAEASHALRVHHQWYPDILFIEKGLNMDTQQLLRAKGHKLQYRGAMGSTQTIMFKDGYILGASDPRRPDARTLGY